MNAPVQLDSREDAYATPIDRIDVSNPHLYQDDTWRPYFERLRREDPVHWCENGIYGAFWSRHPLPRHHGGRHQPQGLLLRRADGRHRAARPADGFPAAELHLDGPAETRRAAQDRRADRRADEPGQRCPAPSANAPAASWTACRAAKPSIGSIASRSNSPPRCWRPCSTSRSRSGRKLTYWSNVASVNTRAGTEIDSEAKRNEVLDKARRILHRALARAGEAAAAPGPDLDAGARRGDARSAVPAARVHGQPDAADRRRQRHHAQLDLRRRAGAEPVPRSVPQAA